ncbi:MAG TPA: HAD family hydrolase, partial [Candidatus Ruthenibacterium avium]|nr:HAD family hydrolase [Candidatus Ruthenibacterium avium]
IGRVQDGILTIEEWVMSCRVFKRDLELAVFDALIAYCRTHNITSIEGDYLPTAKNAYVRTLYPTLGFLQTAESEEGTHYRFDIPAESAPLCSVIEVTSLL